MKPIRSKTIAVLRALAPYAAMLAVTAWLLTGFSLPVYSLFQSSVSPVATPTAAPPTNTPKPAPQPTNTPVPPPPTPTDTPVPAATTEEPTATAVQPTAETRSAVVTQTEMLTSTEAITPVQPLSAVEPEPAPPEAVAEQPPVVEQPPAAEAVDTGGVVVNEVKLVDTIVKGLAYGWMCIGGGLLLAILAIFPLLQLRGARLNRDDNS